MSAIPQPHLNNSPYQRAQELLRIIYRRRNWSQDTLRRLDDPTHPDLKDIHVLAEKLHQLRVNNQHLVIYPDFDMDGITSAMVAYAGFSQLGFTVSLFIPDYKAGHGFRPADVNAILAEHPDAAAIITTDTGITSFDGINEALNRGLEVYVTDHHLESDGRSNATVIVNPGRMDETYPLVGICGAHVIFQVLDTYTRTYQPDQRELIDYLVLFAGIGTVADVMPLVQENRLVVKRSLSLLKLLYPYPNPHLPGYTITPDETLLMQLIHGANPHPVYARIISRMALVLSTFIEAKKLRSPEDITSTFYGFYLAPTFNAIRRTEIPLEHAFEVFLNPDETTAREHMNTLMDNNAQRKQMVQDLLESIYSTEQPHAPYVYTVKDAPAGMVGLLANSIMSTHQLPVVVLHEGGTGGSARSPLWYPLNTRINTQAGMKAIGHDYACGVMLDEPGRIPELAQFLAQDSTITQAQLEATGQWNPSAADLMLGADESSDAALVDVIDALPLVTEALQQLAPFGHSYEEPTVRVRLYSAKCSFRVMGSEAQHLKINTEEGLTILGWNKAHLYDELTETTCFDVIGTLNQSTFNDVVSTNLIISEVLPITES